MIPPRNIKLEFSRPLLTDRVPRKGSHEVFAAEPAECAALAKRFDLPAINSLKAHLIALPWRGGGIKVTGTVEAELDQISVISLEKFASKQKFEVERYYLPPKILVDAVEDDADPIENGEIDLGELVSETLGLELEPYPRKPGETYDDPVLDSMDADEKPPSPFAKMLKLDRKTD
jgi:uncharacterized metal-binding protein YceD (DUF177 family)